jgi:16S rRNA (uracil1498-N3)-methyltransferase
VSDDRVEFELGEAVASVTLLNISLLMAIYKFDRMEWAIEKCTELGVAGIVPVVARRTDAHLASAAAKRIERWVRIANQASEQARRAVPTRIEQPMKMKEAVLRPAALRILLAESEDKLTLADALEGFPFDQDILLAVGPEGGWADEELTLFAQAGWTAASLGSTILRAETAAIAATAIAFSALT